MTIINVPIDTDTFSDKQLLDGVIACLEVTELTEDMHESVLARLKVLQARFGPESSTLTVYTWEIESFSFSTTRPLTYSVKEYEREDHSAWTCTCPAYMFHDSKACKHIKHVKAGNYNLLPTPTVTYE